MAVTEPGVALAHYIDDHGHTHVQIFCRGCGWWGRWSLAAASRRLETLGRDPGRVGVRELGALLPPCAVCGVQDWDARPDFPPGLSKRPVR